MGLVNTDDLVLFGPGSEWFWSMLQFVVVAVTLLGIYYQLRLDRSANAFTQLGGLVDEWQGEQMSRKRLAVLVALREGADDATVPGSAALWVATYWEKVAALVRAGHVALPLVAEGLGAADTWWGILGPWVQRVRTEDANPNLFEHFEWLAGALVRRHPALAFDRESFDRTIEERITYIEAALRDFEAMRTVTP